MDFKKISEVTGVDAEELKNRFEIWQNSSKKKKQNPDLKLIASFCDLSISSVSGYYNKKGSISERKGKIIDAVTYLIDYRPSNAAKKLRSEKKMSIAFIAPITNSPSTEYSVELLKGVISEARKFGYFVDIYDIGADEKNFFSKQLPFLGLVDGVILVSSSIHEEVFQPLVQKNIPIFQINPLEESRNPPFIGSVNSDVTPFVELLDHLFSKHMYKNPILISLPIENHPQRKKKYSEYVEAMRRYDLDFDESKNLITVQSYSFQGGSDAYQAALKINPKSDVYICLSDIIAVSFLQSQNNSEKRVAVTGYSDYEISKLFELTTIDQKVQNMGNNAFQSLFYAMQYIQMHKALPEYQTIVTPSQLVLRNSCSC